MPIIIAVPPEDRDEAQARGAIWEEAEKAWLAPDNRNMNDFIEWIHEDVSIIARSPFYIGLSSKPCWKCHKETRVIALASDNYFFLDRDKAKPKWEAGDGFSFFSMPTFIDSDTQAILRKAYPFFKLGYSRTVGGSYWANHCEHCNLLQGNFYLHDEDEGAFSPLSIDQCKKITLINVPAKYDMQIEAILNRPAIRGDLLRYSKKDRL